MKKLFIIANWKSNKNIEEATQWIQGMSSFKFPPAEEKEVIICPPFTLLSTLKSLIDGEKLPIKIGSENLSPFGQGAYTGEESAEQVKEFAEYVILGHSERRKNFGETDEVLSQKVKKALDNNLTPIYCVQGIDTPIPAGVQLVAYEPVFAIGTGTPDTPEDAEFVAKTIKEKHSVKYVIYGGSVTGEDVRKFTQLPSVDGVLVGGASLDAEKFIKIIENS